jgi:hypothetical protein
MRHCNFFSPEKTPSEERRRIMTGFVRQVRQLLDRTVRPGQHRWLCVRIPCYQAALDPLGIDVNEFAAAGVEMFNLSPYYFTEQQTDAAAIKRLLPNAAVFLEMAHTTCVGPAVSAKTRYDNFSFRRTTELQFYTAAHLAYARGLDGVSAFNFVYYREHGYGERGPFNEPPFHVFRHLGDATWLARQPQHYILGAVWNAPRLADRPLPRTLHAGQSASFRLDMSPPTDGWQTDGRLRIRAEKGLGESVWTAIVNGVPLRETPDRGEPYANPYSPLLGEPSQHRAWLVPKAILADGMNTVEVIMNAGEGSARLEFLDLAVA